MRQESPAGERRGSVGSNGEGAMRALSLNIDFGSLAMLVIGISAVSLLALSGF
jgi:hypothetical protein